MTSDEREYGAYIDDIVDAAEKIERFTEDMTGDEFRDDEKTVDAVLRNFEVIEEATKKVPETVHQEYDDIPWTEMAGMRDTLIHGSSTVDLDIVWTTVEMDLPNLLPKLKAARDDFHEGPSH